MTLPRFLTPSVLARLAEADKEYQENNRTGPMVVEIHYGSGTPGRVKVRCEDEVRVA